jgi:hypothetical protein
MKHRILILALALFSTSAFAARTSGFAVNVLVDDMARSEYFHGGNVYVEAVRGASYSLRITNPTPYRVAVALSVDGLNTIDAKHTDARSASKWVLEPYESTVISGWQVSDRDARNFYFTGERHSYGAKLGQTENLGVIEAVYFRERPHEAEIYRHSMRDERSNAAESGLPAPPPPPPSLSEDSAAPSAKAQRRHDTADDYAATGMGDRAEHEIHSVNIDLDPTPLASVRIRYEFRPQLVKLGIFPQYVSPLERRERASGFGAYCPE